VNPGPGEDFAVVFRGSKSLCHEFSLVLEARGIEHETLEGEGAWTLNVPVALLGQAYDEISRYSAERSAPRSVPGAMPARPGATLGAIVYVMILLLAAYSAGNGSFGADWFSIGSLDAGSPTQWWRAITALTLHVDQEHWLGNVLFGVIAGMGAGRLLGPGIAWASILGAAALANYLEMLIAPVNHRAVGASTAVFGALGLLAGMAWRQRLTLRERVWYRWAPLIAGICLLTLLGAGNAQVDVLGHALGFIMGTGLGWVYARLGFPRHGGRRVQILAGVGAVLFILVAWLLALSHRL
jgi:membrane associated rhomboid family serine protease